MNHSRSSLVLACLLIAPPAVCAQEVFHVRPSITTAAVYDSNLFWTASNRQADVITRVSPALDAEYRSAIWTLKGRSMFEVERFAEHPELTTVDARHRAAVGFEYRPTRRLTMNADGEHSRFQTPGELNTVSGLAFTRARTERFVAHAAVARQLSRAGAGTIDYLFTDDRVADALIARMHAIALGTRRRLSSIDTFSVNTRIQQFRFESRAALSEVPISSVGSSSATSAALTVGWARNTRGAAFAIETGPRVTNRLIAPDVSAWIRFPLQGGNLALAYARTQTALVGLAGMADFQSVTATATWNPGRLRIDVSPAVTRGRHSTLEADVYRLTVDVARPIARGVLLAVTAGGSLQLLELQTRPWRERIRQQQIMVRIVADHGVQRR